MCGTIHLHQSGTPPTTVFKLDPPKPPPKMEIPIDPGRPIKHVSRKALYTRLEARINYLRDMLDFNSSTFHLSRPDPGHRANRLLPR